MCVRTCVYLCKCVSVCVRDCLYLHVCVCVSLYKLTIRRELVPLEEGDTQDVLIQVLNEELAVEVPLGVERVVERA